MEKYLRANGSRGAALAIVEGTRLLYAKGYTFAEPNYPDIEPTTCLHGKCLEGLLCRHGLEGAAGRPAALQSKHDAEYLGLKQSDGLTPADSRFAAITSRHLLESCSGSTRGQCATVWPTFRAISGCPAGFTIDIVEFRCRADDDRVAGRPTVYGRTEY